MKIVDNTYLKIINIALIKKLKFFVIRLQSKMITNRIKHINTVSNISLILFLQKTKKHNYLYNAQSYSVLKLQHFSVFYIFIYHFCMN